LVDLVNVLMAQFVWAPRDCGLRHFSRFATRSLASKSHVIRRSDFFMILVVILALFGGQGALVLSM